MDLDDDELKVTREMLRVDKVKEKTADEINDICKCCGECCSNYLPLRKEEIRTMKRLAKVENRHFLRKDWYERCPFLNNNNKCDIYENRPLICREYSCYNFENNIYNENFLKDISFGGFNLVDIRKEIFGNKRRNNRDE